MSIQEKLQIKVKYHDPDLVRIEKITIGDWIDVRSAEDLNLKKGDRVKVSLGMSAQLPEGYEAYLLPRSSSCDKFGFIITNSKGVIDESYRGNNDVWKLAILVVADEAVIRKNDRIAQFRIMEKMPPVEIIEVDDLENEDRGGFGSTGTN